MDLNQLRDLRGHPAVHQVDISTIKAQLSNLMAMLGRLMLHREKITIL